MADTLDPLVVFVEEAISIDEGQKWLHVVKEAPYQVLPQTKLWQGYPLLQCLVSNMLAFVNLLVDDIMGTFQGTVPAALSEPGNIKREGYFVGVSAGWPEGWNTPEKAARI